MFLYFKNWPSYKFLSHRNLMLEAFYEKTSLAKCFENCLEMHFEYSHVSVAQKLTELRIFGCHQLLIALYDKMCLPNCVGNSLEMLFEYLNISVAQKLTELRFFCCQRYSRVNLEKSRFLTDSFFWPTNFLTTNLCDNWFFDN